MPGGSWRTPSPDWQREPRRTTHRHRVLPWSRCACVGRFSLTPSLGLGCRGCIPPPASWLKRATAPSKRAAAAPARRSRRWRSAPIRASYRPSYDWSWLFRLVADLSLSLAASFDATLSHVTPPLVAVPVTKDGMTSSQIVELAMPPLGSGARSAGPALEPTMSGKILPFRRPASPPQALPKKSVGRGAAFGLQHRRYRSAGRALRALPRRRLSRAVTAGRRHVSRAG